jgi:hypothetical protein
MANLLELMKDNGGQLGQRIRFNVLAGFAAGSAGRATGANYLPLAVPVTDLVIGGLLSKESFLNYATFGAGVGLAYVDKAADYVSGLFK